jgi:formyltetrahydrofolate synthetase
LKAIGIRKGTFFNIMKTQLAKLGILVERHTYVSITPDDLLPEERSKFVRLDIDPNSVTWNRVLAVCDWHLRQVQAGEGPNEMIQLRGTVKGETSRPQHSRIVKL